MKKYVGVVGTASNDELLKQASLLCDEVLCGRAENSISRAVELGLVRVDLPQERNRALESMPEERYSDARAAVETPRLGVVNTVRSLRSAAAALRASVDDSTSVVAVSHVRVVIDQTSALLGATVTTLLDLLTRMECELLRLGNPEDVFVPLTVGISLPSSSLGTNASVTVAVLKSLPLPDASTPWEAIRDWKCDPQATEQYRTLRAWIAKLAREGLSAADVEEEIVARLATYKAYMAVQHKKMRRGRLEAVVLPIASALEDIVQLRLSKGAERLFGIFRQEVALLESELTAPGREVAYIANTSRRFEPRRPNSR